MRKGTLVTLFFIIVVGVRGRYENVNVKQDWWETAIIYQIYVRSFMDSDADGIGDINGITSKLKYLNNINVGAILLSPIFKSPMNDFGYDVTDFYTVHPEYGTTEDLEQLVKKANELNIKVLLDFVPNHTSNDSEWFVKSSHRDEYYSTGLSGRADIWTLKGIGARQIIGRISVFGKSAWTYAPSRDQYFLHQFSVAQPDLNYRNPVLVEEMKTIMKFWLEKGVAGMRLSSINYLIETDKEVFGGRYPNEPITGTRGVELDDYNYLDHIYTKDQDETYDLVSQFREAFDSITIRDKLTRILMTEACTGIKSAVKYYGEGAHSGAHIPLNFALIDLDKGFDARDMKNAVDRWLTYKPMGKPANWITGNHDRSRVASRFRPELVDAFNMLLLLLPGIAVTYMGEELGMSNGFVPWSQTRDPLACRTDDPVQFAAVSRDPARMPFQWNSGKNAGFSVADNTWLPIAEGYETRNVDHEEAAARSHYQVYRALSALRTRPAFRLGRYESLALTSDVFAFKRWYNDDAYVVIMNFGRSYQVVNLTAFDLIFGQLEVEVSSVLSSRAYGDSVQATYLDLAADEALVVRMQV